MKKAYQNGLLLILNGILSTIVFSLAAYFMAYYGAVSVAAYSIARQSLRILSVGLIILALVVPMIFSGNKGKIGTIVLLAFAGLFSVIYFAAGREIAFLYTNDTEVIALCGYYATTTGVAILIASAIAYVLYLATKNLPWFVPLIITAVTGIVVYVVSSLFVRIANPSLTAASCGIMVPIAALIPALRIVNAGIPKEECEAKQEANGQKTVATAKSKVVSALLAFFLGTTGAHRYYLDYKKQGIIQTCGFASLIIGYAMYVPAMMGGSTGMLLFSALFLLYGAGIGIWAFVDFIRILTGGLTPADGSAYTESRPAQVQVIHTVPSSSDNIEVLEKLAKLHEQGILTDEEFQQKKTELLAKM